MYFSCRLDLLKIGIKGYEWVGWKNDSSRGNKPVTLSFKFDTVRQFQQVS